MVKYATLFERLGVEPDADDEAVHAAFAYFFAQFGGDELAIPQDVRDAYRFLAVTSNRQHYRDLLDACDSGHPLEFTPDKIDSLIRLCQLTEIVVFRDRYRENTFHFRRPDQPPPRWLQPYIEPHEIIQKAPSLLWEILTFRLFRGASARRKIALALAYGVAFVALVGGMEWIIKGRDNSRFATFAIGPTPAAIELAQRQALEKSIRAKHAAASDMLKRIDADTKKLGQDFKHVVGMDWEKADANDTPKPRALDLAIIRNDSVREAWTSLLAARVKPEELDAHHKAVERIGAASKAGSFRTEDEKTLQQAIEWGQGREQVLQSQARNIEHLRVMLAAETFELSGSDRERSTP